MVVLSTQVSYTTQLSGSTFHSGELYNTTEWWYFHSRELYNTTELTHELSDVWNIPVIHRQIDLHALIMKYSKHRVLRIEPNITAVQKCASRSTEIAC